MYNIRMGQPEMEEFWNNLKKRLERKQLVKQKQNFFIRLEGL